MNKLIPLILIILLSIMPPMVSAQENEQPIVNEPVIEWELISTRTIHWIGESIDVAINGSGNTSFSLELRMFNSTTHVLMNATYMEYHTTNESGGAIMQVPKTASELPGEYRIQIVIDMLVVDFQDVQVNYDPQRYDELQREDIWDYLNGYVQDYIDSSKGLDRYEMKELNMLRNFCYILTAALIFIVLMQFQEWINRFVEWRKKHGKGSFTVRIMSRAEDRTRDYGGAVIGGSEAKIGDNCLGLTKNLADEGVEWNLLGKTTAQVMPQVLTNAQKMGCKMPQKAKHEGKPKKVKKEKRVKPIKVKKEKRVKKPKLPKIKRVPVLPKSPDAEEINLLDLCEMDVEK